MAWVMLVFMAQFIVGFKDGFSVWFTCQFNEGTNLCKGRLLGKTNRIYFDRGQANA